MANGDVGIIQSHFSPGSFSNAGALPSSFRILRDWKYFLCVMQPSAREEVYPVEEAALYPTLERTGVKNGCSGVEAKSMLCAAMQLRDCFAPSYTGRKEIPKEILF